MTTATASALGLYAEMVAYADASYDAGDDLIEVVGFLAEQGIPAQVFDGESREALVEKMQSAAYEARPRNCRHCEGFGCGDVWYDEWAERESTECVECHGTGEPPVLDVVWSDAKPVRESVHYVAAE